MQMVYFLDLYYRVKIIKLYCVVTTQPLPEETWNLKNFKKKHLGKTCFKTTSNFPYIYN